MKETTCAKVMHIILLVMFTGLFVVGIAVTGVNLSIYDEHVILSFNNPLYIALYLLAGWLLFKGLSIVYDRFLKNVNPFVFAAVSAVIMYALAVFWIFSARALPQSDAEFLIGYAEAINLKEVGPGAMGPDDYLIYFPYQYGFVTFLRVLMYIFGADNYIAFMCVTALSLPVIAFFGTAVITEIAPEKLRGRSAFFFAVAAPLFLPLYFYSSFVYGDLPFAAISLACIYYALRMVRKPSVLTGVFFVLSCFFNYLFKSNALIVCVALFIFFFVKLFDKAKRKIAALLIILTVVGILGVTVTNKAMYDRLNPNGYDAIPMSASIAMGLNDDNGNAGWCNFYHQIIFVENDYDAARTSEVAWGRVRYALTDYIKHPVKGISFFYRKINLQWNTPMFQALAMINSHDEELQAPFARHIYDDFVTQWRINSFLKAYQIFVYFIITAVLWIKRKKESTLGAYLPGIAIFGSFLFSIIWEAKTRYIMPTFVMIIVCFAIALPVVQEALTERETVGIRDFFKTSEAKERRKYNGIDLFKFIMAILVVAVHVQPQSDTQNVMLYRAVDSFAACAVGFFFVAAGFLLGEKMKTVAGYDEKISVIKKYILHILKMYLIWTIIYLPLEIFNDVFFKYPLKETIPAFIRGLLFVGEHFNSWILWYLLSSIYALLFMLLLFKINVKVRTWLIICAFVYLIAFFLDCIGQGNYEGTAIDAVIRPILNATTQNGRIFRGLFFLPFGMYLSQKKTPLWTGVLLAGSGYALGFCGLFNEVPFLMMSVGFFIVARELDLKDRPLWGSLRKMSLAIYFTHLYVWTILYLVLYGNVVHGVKMFVYTLVITLLIALLYTVWAKLWNSRKEAKADGR